MFRKEIDEQIQRVKSSPWAGMLGGEVYRKLEAMLREAAGIVTNSTVTRYVAREASAENPFAAFVPAMITKDERRRALAAIREKLENRPANPEYIMTKLGVGYYFKV